MIHPTIGRIVLVWIDDKQTKAMAAIVTDVIQDDFISVCVFNHNGQGGNGFDLFLWQGEGNKPTYPYAEWMPYQKGQAAKTETLEKKMENK